MEINAWLYPLSFIRTWLQSYRYLSHLYLLYPFIFQAKAIALAAKNGNLIFGAYSD